MNRTDLIEKVNQAINNRVPYAESMVEVFTQMNETQQNYFYDVVMPYYLNGPGYNEYGSMYKDMEYMARAVQHNKDVSQILGVDFRQIGSMLPQLPDISQIPKQEYQQQEFVQQESHSFNEYEKKQMISEMRQLVDEYVTHRGTFRQGIEQGSFAQTNHIDPNNYNVATQGWKFHISANDLADYKRLLEAAVPEFDRLGVHYKVVTPERFEAQCNSNQAGKAITIYPNASFDMNNFSQRLKDILLEGSSIEPIGDAQIAGRIYARYGTFRGNPKEVISQNGSRFLDGRHKEILPEFVNERTDRDILHFYSDAKQRFDQTGDFKTYLQESATMTRGIDGNNAFVTLALQPGTSEFNRIKNVLEQDGNKASFIYQLGNDYYAMIHNDYAAKALTLLNDFGINYERPEWDCRCNLYEVCPQDIESACGFVNDHPFMNWKQLDNGNWSVKVDTAFNKEFEQQCQYYNVRVSTLAINVPEIDLDNQLEIMKGQEEMVQDICD